ncbi:hypothetical protein [Dawidia soli]|uniref:Uncharacterized protein n=1 Tax=Dawidia soli TaxID=2782352 RepID=A0AAP2GCZ4_9BACT|nr:hypothetical protein [Dawidia soli]MBT1686854.1 hypothetical protein [Dawidia soli]
MHEGETIVVERLRIAWKDSLSVFALGGMPKPIKAIISHIISQGYDQVFVPSSSLYTLLISVPIDNKVNYFYTLRVWYDEQIQTIKFRFVQKKADEKMDSVDTRLTKWEETCQASEGIVILEEFLNSNNVFRDAIIQFRK